MFPPPPCAFVGLAAHTIREDFSLAVNGPAPLRCPRRVFSANNVAPENSGQPTAAAPVRHS